MEPCLQVIGRNAELRGVLGRPEFWREVSEEKGRSGTVQRPSENELTIDWWRIWLAGQVQGIVLGLGREDGLGL